MIQVVSLPRVIRGEANQSSDSASCVIGIHPRRINNGIRDVR